MTITIYVDSRAALKALKNQKCRRVQTYLDGLMNFYWVFGHRHTIWSVETNKQAWRGFQMDSLQLHCTVYPPPVISFGKYKPSAPGLLKLLNSVGYLREFTTIKAP